MLTGWGPGCVKRLGMPVQDCFSLCLRLHRFQCQEVTGGLSRWMEGGAIARRQWLVIGRGGGPEPQPAGPLCNNGVALVVVLLPSGLRSQTTSQVDRYR